MRQAARQAAVLGLRSGLEHQSDRTRSELERRLLWICRRSGIPLPEVNSKVGPLEVDFLWRELKLIVETDGYRFHRGPVAFEGDRVRDAKLRLAGFEVLRFSHQQVFGDPASVIEVLRVATSAKLALSPRHARIERQASA